MIIVGTLTMGALMDTDNHKIGPSLLKSRGKCSGWLDAGQRRHGCALRTAPLLLRLQPAGGLFQMLPELVFAPRLAEAQRPIFTRSQSIKLHQTDQTNVIFHEVRIAFSSKTGSSGGTVGVLWAVSRKAC